MQRTTVAKTATSTTGSTIPVVLPTELLLPVISPKMIPFRFVYQLINIVEDNSRVSKVAEYKKFHICLGKLLQQNCFLEAKHVICLVE
jgi:hypothetical protein